MAATTVFSPTAEYILYSSPDGILKLWETETGLLKHEYTPSSHLSATCTCLSWSQRHQMESPRKKKRKKSRPSVEKAESDIVAIGTTSGNILLYSIIAGELKSQLDGGHSDIVNDLAWSTDDASLFSCSSDRHIVHWDVLNGTVNHKWKADKGSVHSLCYCSQNHLLSAGREIKLWNTETQQIIKKFTGHATEVFKLLLVPQTSNTDLHNCYFLSSALNDRIINAWNIDMTSSDKSSIASFLLPDEVVNFYISIPSSTSQAILVAVVIKSGQLLVFEHTLNGKLKKPLKPKVTIQVATPGGKTTVPKPLPILGVHICNDNDNNILLVHGNFIKPVFEKLPYNSSQSEVCLIREDPMQTTVHTETSISKIKTPEVSKDLTTLVPGFMTPDGPSQEPVVSKRKKRKSSVSEMTIEERLNAISMDVNGKKVIEPPKADTLSRLLTQGLQSQDKKILNNVLQNRNDTVIRNSVRKLPVQAVIPLITELCKQMHGHSQSGQVLVKWIKAVLTVHTSYLLTFPEMVDNLKSIYQIVESRTAMFGRLSCLQGKLDLALSQITSQEQPEETALEDQPLLMYQDESSDSDFGMEDVMPSQSELEYDWEDMSDVDDEDDDKNADGAMNGGNSSDSSDEDEDGEEEDVDEGGGGDDDDDSNFDG